MILTYAFAAASFLLVACSAGCLLFAAAHPMLAARKAFAGRISALAMPPERSAADSEAQGRRRQVEDTVREAEEKQKVSTGPTARPPLAARLRQADLAWTPRTFHLRAAAATVFLVPTMQLMGFAAFTALVVAPVAGWLLLHGYVGFVRGRRLKRFAKEFPDALDIIVRGVRAGLPLVDCLKVIALDSPSPVREIFRAVIEDQALGMPLDEAIERLPARMPLPETGFFALVIAIQSRTGGSLSEALANLSKVLRDRQMMRGKVQALSAEAKTSAMIIGALPFMVASLVYLTSPKYVALLFITTTGNIVLAVCAVWMVLGILTMRKMINFDM